MGHPTLKIYKLSNLYDFMAYCNFEIVGPAILINDIGHIAIPKGTSPKYYLRHIRNIDKLLGIPQHRKTFDKIYLVTNE